MPFKPPLPFEFVVSGTAMSAQASSASREAWKARIRAAAERALPADHWFLTVPLAVTIYLFPDGPLAGDVDNRVKPILDAMNRFVYDDDRSVERIVVQKFEPGRVFPFRSPSAALLDALSSDRPVMYVRISDDLQAEFG